MRLAQPMPAFAVDADVCFGREISGNDPIRGIEYPGNFYFSSGESCYDHHPGVGGRQ
jgi:hypothetical protein